MDKYYRQAKKAFFEIFSEEGRHTKEHLSWIGKKTPTSIGRNVVNLRLSFRTKWGIFWRFFVAFAPQNDSNILFWKGFFLKLTTLASKRSVDGGSMSPSRYGMYLWLVKNFWNNGKQTRENGYDQYNAYFLQRLHRFHYYHHSAW